MAEKLKMFIDLDKSRVQFYINYYLEDFKVLIKVPLKEDDEKDVSNIIFDKFDISNKIYIIPIN
ncbi:MAG: hypothetical protein R3255_09340, partial [Candidatus Lokiarchaeia archaeon]|nr:hypothetical protein [Candidatus Lokiarchaeia archaeon]